MKVLYAIQGTGNGHLSRARHLIPILQRHCDLDILVSGTQSEVQLPHDIRYNLRGFSYKTNKKGGVNYWQTFKEGIASKVFRQIAQFPAENYNLIINDFEPISARAARLKGVPCIGLSHQAAYLSNKTPRPQKKDKLGEYILRSYAPVNTAIGFHFEKYDDFIETPVIRQQVRMMNPKNLGHYTVYLPSINDARILNYLQQVPGVKWEVFSRFTQFSYREKNVFMHPVSNEGFIKSFEHCEGILTGAGFEAPAEAIFLGKKVFAIPMFRQYEQQCNAAALEKMGIPIMWRISNALPDSLRTWVNSEEVLHRRFPEYSESIIRKILYGAKEQHKINFEPKLSFA